MGIFINFLKEHYVFLVVSVFLFIALSPAIGLDLTGNDWNNFDYIIKNFGHGFLPFKIPLSFYFTQYGTLYASIAYAMQVFGTNPTFHHINNIFFRIVASIAIYLLVNWWSKRKVAGIIAGSFFAISYPGIESTVWSAHFLTYISVILLCIFLYFWKKFHDSPTNVNLFYSVLLFGLTIFIAHIKIFALPLLVSMGEIYSLIISKKDRFFMLKAKHSLCLAITFLVLYLGTDLMKTTPELSGKILHPYIVLQGLINGYPPIIQSLLLFVSNTVISPDLLKFLENTRILVFNDFSVLIFSIIMILMSYIFFVYVLNAKQYRIAFASLVAIIFPISMYYSTEILKLWEKTWIVSTIVGGTVFILIFLANFVIWRNNRRVLELAVLSIVLLIGHLLLPWLNFTQFQIDTQSAFHWYSRYYTVPVMAMSILWGLLFTYAVEFVAKSYSRLIIIILFLLLFTLNVSQTLEYIKESYIYFNRIRHEQLWNLTSSYFLPLIKNPSKKFVYIEGDMTPKEMGLVNSVFPYQLYVSHEQSPPFSEHSFIFLGNKAEVLDLLRDDIFNKQNFVALRINNGQVEDIKEFLIQEAKK